MSDNTPPGDPVFSTRVRLTMTVDIEILTHGDYPPSTHASMASDLATGFVSDAIRAQAGEDGWGAHRLHTIDRNQVIEVRSTWVGPDHGGVPE